MDLRHRAIKDIEKQKIFYAQFSISGMSGKIRGNRGFQGRERIFPYPGIQHIGYYFRQEVIGREMELVP